MVVNIRKTVVMLILLFSVFVLNAEESEHSRLNKNEKTPFKLEMEIAVKSKFINSMGVNVYDFLPEIGFNFIIFDDYIISISQPFAIKAMELNPDLFPDTKSGVKFALRDLNFGFVWSRPYNYWQFSLGTSLSFPTARWQPKSNDDFVDGSGRYGQSTFLSVSYIIDPVVLGGNFSYTFVTPIINDANSGWIPCIFSVGLNTAIVFNQNFSLTLAGSLDWNSNELMDGKYIPAQSIMAEELKLVASWTEKKWSISGEVALNFSAGQVTPIFNIATTINLFSSKTNNERH